MILISVKSNVVDDKRQFENDAAAMKYLLTINRLHHAHRNKIAGPKPRRFWFTGYKSMRKFKQATAEWKETLASCITLKVEIVNTKFNQLNLPLK